MKYSSNSIANLIEDEFDYSDQELSASAIDGSMVENLSKSVSEVVGGETVEYSDYWSIASGFADHMEENLSEEYDMETAEFYSRISIAALGTIVGAEMKDEGFPEVDLESDWRVTGPLASGICMKTGLINRGLDLGAYGVSWGETSELLEEASKAGYRNSHNIKS